MAAGFAQESGDDARVVEEGGADCEGVGEVERGHGGQLVDVACLDPDAFGVFLSDGVLEAVGLGEEAGRHAGVECKDEECGEVAEGHGAADKSVGVVVRCDEVVPGEEAGIEVSMLEVRLIAILQRQNLRNCSRDVDKRVQLVERCEDRLVVLKEVLLDSDLGEGEEDAEDRLVLKPEDVKSVLLSKLSDLV